MTNMHKRRKEMRQQRRTDTLNQRDTRWLLVSEGKKTEPNYFDAAIKEYNKKLEGKQKIKLDIRGQGMNTVTLVNSANDFIYEVDKFRNRTPMYGKIFVAFDKDSFDDKAFDDAISLCKINGWIPLWSNEAFELWFLLHFDYTDAALSRTQYATKIEEKFSNKGFEYKYVKNDENTYSLLEQYGSLKRAMAYAKKLHLDIHRDDKPSDSNCCTTVYQFFEELNKKIDIDG